MPHIFNVKDDGATGDGITDDSSAVAVTISKAATAGAGTVLFPGNGTYLATGLSWTTDNITIEIGAGATVKKFGTVNEPIFEIGNRSVAVDKAAVIGRGRIDMNNVSGGNVRAILGAGPLTNIILKDFEVFNGAEDGADVIQIGGINGVSTASNVLIENLYVHDVKGGFILNDMENFLVTGCTVNDMKGQDCYEPIRARHGVLAFNYGRNPGSETQPSNSVFDIFNDCTDILLFGNTCIIDRPITGNTGLTGITVGGGGTGAEDRVYIVNNTIDVPSIPGTQVFDTASWQIGIRILSGKNIVIKGGLIRGCLFNNSAKAISSTSEKVVIDGVRFDSCVSGVVSSTLHTVVTNCDFKNMGFAGGINKTQILFNNSMPAARIVALNNNFDNNLVSKYLISCINMSNAAHATAEVIIDGNCSGQSVLQSGAIPIRSTSLPHTSMHIGMNYWYDAAGILWLTKNRGTATMLAGNTTIVVPHGLGFTPTSDMITVSALGDWLATTKFWVDPASIGATNFTITADIAPGGVGVLYQWFTGLNRG
jgi:hypothetical protein